MSSLIRFDNLEFGPNPENLKNITKIQILKLGLKTLSLQSDMSDSQLCPLTLYLINYVENIVVFLGLKGTVMNL